MAHILFICTANICRSPMAEAIFRDKAQKRGFTDWQVSSAGTWATVERGASRNGVIVMAKRGLDISQHRARMVTGEMLADSDLVLCMERGHAEALRAEFPTQATKIYLLSEMTGRRFDIADPYTSPVEEYEHTANEISQLLEQGWPRILSLVKAT